MNKEAVEDFIKRCGDGDLVIVQVNESNHIFVGTRPKLSKHGSNDCLEIQRKGEGDCLPILLTSIRHLKLLSVYSLAEIINAISNISANFFNWND